MDIESGDMKKIINITGGCRGCGATFTAVALSLVMARSSDRVTYMEDFSALAEKRHFLEEPNVFYELSLDKHISRRRFADFALLKENGKRTDNRVNLYSNVNWVVKLPDSTSAINVMPNEVAGEYIMWDSTALFTDNRLCSYYSENKTNRINEGTSSSCILTPNLILCVIDPLPSRVMASQKHIDFLKECFGEITLWIFNNGTSEDITYAEKFLGIKADFCIPMEETLTFYEAQRRNTHPVACDNLGRFKYSFKAETVQAFESIAQYILTLY